jgi:hypothetical protein
MILNSYILLTTCSSKLSYRNFTLGFIMDLLEEGGTVLQTHTTPQAIATPSTN